MTNYDIIILTTSVTRPDLHNIIFPKYINFVKGLTVKWIIHVNKILDQSTIDTRDNLITLLKDTGIDVEFTLTDSGGTKKDFFQAVQFISNQGLSLANHSKYGILLLEDDWLLTDETATLKNLLEKHQITDIDNKKYYIRLSVSIAGHIKPHRRFFGLCAGFWSTDIFQTLFSYITKHYPEADYPDPEGFLYSYVQKAERRYLKDVTYINERIFLDAGRPWQKNRLDGLRTFSSNQN
jgi:hypothetical protein